MYTHTHTHTHTAQYLVKCVMALISENLFLCVPVTVHNIGDLTLQPVSLNVTGSMQGT